MKSIYTSALFLFIIAAIISICDTGCANIIPPLGGPRDTIAPKLIKAVPKDSATNITSNKIVLTFNEFVEVKDVSNNLIVSPIPKQNPIIDYKLNTVTVKLKDTLEPNTTYTINFGNSVKDVNEGNIAKNFSYVFSTGKHIDSGFITGKVILAQSGKIDSTLIVVLYKNLSDTAVAKETPKYFTKLDGKGNFIFGHLPYGTFNVFVMENAYDKRYNDSTKIFGFLNAPIVVSDNTEHLLFYAYAEAEKKDSKKTTTTATPSAKGGKSKAEPKLRVAAQFDNGQQELIQPLELLVSKKLKSYDSSKIILCDTLNRPLKNVTYSLDTSQLKISINYKWREETDYRLLIDSTAAFDSSNQHLVKKDTVRFITKKESDYGSLKLRFNNLDLKKNPVLLFYKSENALTESVPLTSNQFYRKLIKPGDFELRILYDDNKNGIWDPGNYKKKKQPEIVQFIPKKITIRANWDNEITINL